LSRCLIFLFCIPLFYNSSRAQVAHRYDIVIDEIFPDPSPAVGLPDAEFIELRNISGRDFNLKGWTINAGNHPATIKNSFILKPDSFAILCSTNASQAFENFGSTIGIAGFPSLSNEGMLVSLLDSTGQVIHAVSYDPDWYGNELKLEGGWSLEMIDPHSPCTGESNWKASTDPMGGTPGRINSVNNQNPDTVAPQMISSICLNQHEIMVTFDESLDSVSASDPLHFNLNSIGPPVKAEPQLPLLDKVKLQFETGLDSATVYNLFVQSLTDCAGNPANESVSLPVALFHPGNPLDLIINEILFNPLPNGYDYVEIYNRSNKTIDIRHWALANRKADGTLYNIQWLNTESRPIFPGDYLVFSENRLWVSKQYLVQNPGNLIQLGSLPSLPDDEGDLVLLSDEGQVIDEVAYSHQWQSPLLANEEGVALERMNVDQPSQDPANWASAASTAGFGTPTYRNSEFSGEIDSANVISISPKIFSPDGDGFDDFCFLNYRFAQPGYTGNLTLYSSSGIPVRYLLKNASFSREGRIRWDGLDENFNRLPMGIYIVYLEIFNLKGELRQFKTALTLVRRFK
jgi:hypothetical protein